MKHVVMFDRLAFQRHKLNPDGSESIEPDGPEEIVYQGHPVPDYVPSWQRDALANSGMIIAVAEAPVPMVIPEPVGPPAPVVADVSPDAIVAEAPAPNATRGEWETYATSDAVGLTAEEAESYPNKQALIDAVNAKLASK